MTQLSPDIVTIAEGETPEHVHTFVWEEERDFDPQIVGARCSYEWLIPSAPPRGKKPRPRRCAESISMDEAIGIINKSFDALLVMRRQQRIESLRAQLGDVQNELDVLTNELDVLTHGVEEAH